MRGNFVREIGFGEEKKKKKRRIEGEKELHLELLQLSPTLPLSSLLLSSILCSLRPKYSH